MVARWQEQPDDIVRQARPILEEARDNEPVTVGRLARLLLRRAWVLALCVAATMGLASAFLLVATPQYTAYMIIAPKESQSSAGGLREAFSTLQQIVEVPNLSAFGNDAGLQFGIFREMLTSSTIAGALAAKEEILPLVFGDSWDPELNEWRAPGGLVARLKYGVLEAFGRAGWMPPTSYDLAVLLKKRVRIIPIADDSMVRVEFNGADPDFAARLLAGLFRETDGWLRHEALESVDARMSYIAEQLSQTSQMDQRDILASLMSRIESMRLVAETDANFAAQLVEGPVVSSNPTWPPIPLTLALAAIFGLLIGAIFVIVSGRPGARRR